MRVIFLLLLFTASLKVAAHEPKDGDIRAMFGGFTYRTMTPQPAAIHLDPALAVEADVSKHGGVEVSMFYLRNAFYLRRYGDVLAEQIKRVYIATGYRHWFTPKFSTALAFASSYTIGNYKVLKDSYGNTARPDTSAHDITEYGLDLSVQYEPWSWERFAVVVDGRYGWSLTPKKKEDAHHMGVLIAIKYFIQSRQTELED
ncbi:MAG: hypothetical protein KF799_14690 [Bdellovibrionales bacterium]|nr:hypothetical protein [Bdellovibrionales bacterium]